MPGLFSRIRRWYFRKRNRIAFTHLGREFHLPEETCLALRKAVELSEQARRLYLCKCAVRGEPPLEPEEERGGGGMPAPVNSWTRRAIAFAAGLLSPVFLVKTHDTLKQYRVFCLWVYRLRADRVMRGHIETMERYFQLAGYEIRHEERIHAEAELDGERML